MPPIVAIVAMFESVSTPNASDASMVTAPRLAFRRPAMASISLTRDSDIPLYCISPPASTKNGMARYEKLSSVVYKPCA